MVNFLINYSDVVGKLSLIQMLRIPEIHICKRNRIENTQLKYLFNGRFFQD